jgi:hypothetical protein
MLAERRRGKVAAKDLDIWLERLLKDVEELTKRMSDSMLPNNRLNEGHIPVDEC